MRPPSPTDAATVPKWENPRGHHASGGSCLSGIADESVPSRRTRCVTTSYPKRCTHRRFRFKSMKPPPVIGMPSMLYMVTISSFESTVDGRTPVST